MKFQLLAIICAANVALANVLGQRAGRCNADNCARAVSGTRRGGPHSVTASSDCASFLLAIQTSTVTPGVVTVTATSSTATTSTIATTQIFLTTETDLVLTTNSITIVDTLTSTSTSVSLVDSPVMRRSLTSSNHIPTYASACSNAAAYSSACSCFGVFPMTTVLYTTLVTPTASATIITLSSAVETDTASVTSTVTTVTSSTAIVFTTTSTTTSLTTTALKSCQTPIVNGGFEDSDSIATGWNVQSPFDEQAIGHDNPSGAQAGSNYLIFSDPFFQYTLSQTVTVCPGLAYTLTFWLQGTNQDGDFKCDATYCVGSTCQSISGGYPNNQYGEYSLVFPGTTGGADAVVVSFNGAIDQPCSADQVLLDSFALTPLM